MFLMLTEQAVDALGGIDRAQMLANHEWPDKNVAVIVAYTYKITDKKEQGVNDNAILREPGHDQPLGC